MKGLCGIVEGGQIHRMWLGLESSRTVARADRDRGVAGWQARALRKAPGPVARRGEADGRGGPGHRPCELGELPLPLGAVGAIPERAARDRRGRRGAADLHELLQRGGAGPSNADPVAADSRRGWRHPGRHRIAPDRPGVVAPGADPASARRPVDIHARAAVRREWHGSGGRGRRGNLPTRVRLRRGRRHERQRSVPGTAQPPAHRGVRHRGRGRLRNRPAGRHRRRPAARLLRGGAAPDRRHGGGADDAMAQRDPARRLSRLLSGDSRRASSLGHLRRRGARASGARRGRALAASGGVWVDLPTDG